MNDNSHKKNRPFKKQQTSLRAYFPLKFGIALHFCSGSRIRKTFLDFLILGKPRQWCTCAPQDSLTAPIHELEKVSILLSLTEVFQMQQQRFSYYQPILTQPNHRDCIILTSWSVKIVWMLFPIFNQSQIGKVSESLVTRFTSLTTGPLTSKPTYVQLPSKFT